MNKHINHYWLALALLLPALSACNDDNDTMPGEEPGTAGTPTVIRASIGSEPDTRAQVKWGTQNAAEGEYFMWNAGDQFKAYNITAAETAVTPTAYTFNIDDSYDEENPGNQADFNCDGFQAANGDKIAAFYGSIYGSVAFVADANGKKGIQAVLERVSASQSQTATPGNADLKHLRGQLCMYAIGQAEGSGSVSPLSFRHLSALFRITIRNQQSDEAKIKYTGIIFPDNEKIVCTKKTVTIWEDNTVEHGVAENDKLSATGNGLTNTNGYSPATIAPGSSYDCFIAAMPVAKEGNTASSITIGVWFDGQTELKSVAIAGFSDEAIKAGMRYWFDLTVKADGTLVQTRTLTDAYAWYASNTDATEYTLSTPGELRALANLVNGTEEAKAAAGVSGAVNFAGKTVRLTADIDLSGETWTPIGTSGSKAFSGTFDGGGYHISKLSVDNGSNDYAGLFGYVYEGTVRNLRVSGTVTTTGSNAGGIAGYLYGSTVENCIFDGDVSAGDGAGGIAGYSLETSRIAGCHTKGTATATYSGSAGGIAGYNDNSTIDGCYSEAEVKAGNQGAGGIAGSNELGGAITHCYATGKVSGKGYAGGIVGYQSDGTITGCIALNPGLTRTEGYKTSFGRIVGSNQGTVTSCGAYDGMTFTDATGSFDATGEHGTALPAAQCLTTATYTTTHGFTEATAAATGWAFDSGATWTYLPWNKAFESFPGISETDYRISVPAHLNGGGTN